ncbi:TPA: PTS sugar transporter subunit IIC [Enterococcus faecium]
MNNITIALLIGLIGFLGPMDFAIGSNLLNRPIIMGPLVGIVLGDFTQGIIIGASLELIFMGAVSVERIFRQMLLGSLSNSVVLIKSP